jgi:hypothetical protein
VTVLSLDAPQECHGCVSSAHYRLFFAMDRGDQARVSSPEVSSNRRPKFKFSRPTNLVCCFADDAEHRQGGRIDHMIIVTDDSEIANILRDGKSLHPKSRHSFGFLPQVAPVKIL